MRLATTMALLVAVIADACTVGPDYVRPNVQTPPAWRIDYPQAADLANTRWWDLFGRVRRQSESAQALVYASEQGRRGVVLSVVTSVAATYIGLRALDRQLEISQQTARNYAETQRLFDLQHKGGVVSQLELAQV